MREFFYTFQAATRSFRRFDLVRVVGSLLYPSIRGTTPFASATGARVALLPRQEFAILVQESSCGLGFELVDALQEPANRLVRLDQALAARHLGAHRARMQDDYGDSSRLEVVSQTGTGRIQRSL